MDDETRRRLTTRFGAGIVDPWWAQLGWLIDDLARRWDLTKLGPLGRGNTSLVLRCRAGRRAAVLKLTPEPALAAAEAEALAVWSDSGAAVGLLAADAERGALLLERLHPAPIHVPAARAAELIVALHSTPTASDHGRASERVPKASEDPRGSPPAGGISRRSLPTLRERLPEGFDIAERRGAPWAHRRAMALALAEDEVPAVLLHGDLHVGNVMAGPKKRLVAIDPRPCLGDPAWDAADWVLGDRGRCEELAAAIGSDPERLWAWHQVFAV